MLNAERDNLKSERNAVLKKMSLFLLEIRSRTFLLFTTRFAELWATCFIFLYQAVIKRNSCFGVYHWHVDNISYLCISIYNPSRVINRKISLDVTIFFARRDVPFFFWRRFSASIHQCGRLFSVCRRVRWVLSCRVLDRRNWKMRLERIPDLYLPQ